ncbi:MAG TPA: nicotinate-nucleotide adenylyltransferase [Candidatus Saccharimonadales bacterium]|nr:nicotinate-nucleotide adenylyltransferase [Candidatus Saccharimonadales bacterium]
MKLGLFGGTFDPVHRGHLEAAARARAELGLDRVLWLVAGDPPHKRGRPLSAAGHRLRMLELALAGTPGMGVCEVETLRPGPSYTIETLRAFRALLPRARLVFLVGMDSLLELPGWREPRAILDFGVIAVPRPGFDVRRVPAWVRRRVVVLRGPRVRLAASGLRRRLRRGLDLAGEVPDPVCAYIREHHLYRPAPGAPDARAARRVRRAAAAAGPGRAARAPRRPRR